MQKHLLWSTLLLNCLCVGWIAVPCAAEAQSAWLGGQASIAGSLSRPLVSPTQQSAVKESVSGYSEIDRSTQLGLMQSSSVLQSSPLLGSSSSLLPASNGINVTGYGAIDKFDQKAKR